MPEQFQAPKVRTIDVQLKAGFGEAWLRLQVTELGGAGWSVCPVPFNLQCDEFDVVPETDVEPARAWDFARELRACDGVVDAEPTFEVLYAEPRAQAFTGVDPDIIRSPQLLESLGGPAESGGAYDWSVKLVQAEEAWELPGGVARQGQGIRIGHPDSGYEQHAELGTRFNPVPGWDFIEQARPTQNPGGDHGLRTASVISSADNRPQPSVTGIAPGAEVIPLRVTKPHGFIPAPVLFETGTDRLRDAIWYALEHGFHVLSISLGWLPNAGLHRAIQEAVKGNIIVISAAGNHTGRVVVWPAAYPEVIAMAACTAQRTPWQGSARGPAVDATGPGEGVWTADMEKYVAPSSGTSYAVATVAGIAALWLAHHGRDNLLARYKDGPRLSQVFRHMLRASCQPWEQSEALWGAGIVNALECLKTPLPEFPAPERAGTMATSRAALTAERLEDAFPAIPEPRLHQHLARVLGVDGKAVPKLLAEHGRELRFWLLTQPGFRRALAESSVPALETSRGAERPTLPRFSDGLSKALREARLTD